MSSGRGTAESRGGDVERRGDAIDILPMSSDDCAYQQRLADRGGIGESSNSLATLGPDTSRPSQNDAILSSPSVQRNSHSDAFLTVEDRGSAYSDNGSNMSVADSDDEEKLSSSSSSCATKPKVDQAELRKQILKIQSDSSIPAPEKAKRIQELMSRPWINKQKQVQKQDTRISNYLVNKSDDFSIVRDHDREQTFHSENVLGCKHYQRACKLQAHCCGKWDTCRFCHDEVSDHTITRNLVKTMLCMYCWEVQPAGKICINETCGKAVSAYYCKECKLWDNDPRKNIYHCYDCGICRIGKGLGIDYFHCPTCNVCMAIGLKGKHKCIERNLESDCPICGEYMFTSTSTVIFMPCGHCMHHKCHQQHIHTSYQCPTCLKSLADMSEYFKRIDIALAQHKMPDEYKDTYSHIYCNDCEKKSHARYHFIYHKCGHCTGYNTKVLGTQVGLAPGAVIAPDVVIPANITTVPPPETLSRLASSNSIISSISGSGGSNESEDFPTSGYWCHQCQGPTELAEDEMDKCAQCFSDFVEKMD